MVNITILDQIEYAAMMQRWCDDLDQREEVHSDWDRRKATRGNRRHVDRKPHRRAYTGAKAVDGTCRNHGSCTYCVAARTHQDTRDRQVADEQIAEWEDV